MTGKIIILFFCFVFLFQFARPVTWTVVSPGYWSSGSTWSSGVVPSSSSADTFLIRYPVALTSNLYFQSGARIQIDSAGGLCGHYKMTMNSGTAMFKRGILELDTLDIPGGNVACLGPGVVILTLYGMLSNGGSLSVIGCAMNVGAWFNCVQPEYSFVNGIEEIGSPSLIFFPNPGNGHFNITSSLVFLKARLRISDAMGRIVYEEPASMSNETETIDVSFLGAGIYYWELDPGNEKHMRGKIEVVK